MMYLVFGLFISLIVYRFSGPAVSNIRRRAFRRQRKQEYNRPENDLLNVNSPGSRFSQAYESLGQISRPLHATAVEKQNHYQEALMSMTCLMFFSLIVLSWTAVFSQPLGLKVTFVWAELFCLLLLLKKYVQTRKLVKKWVRARAAAELVREARFLKALSYKAWTSEEAQSDSLKNFAEDTLNDVNSSHSEKELARTVRSYSDRILKDCEKELAELTQGDAATYMHRRIGRQLNWFRASSKRLHLETERNALLALIVFSLTVLLAFIKTMFVSKMVDLGPNVTNIVTFSLLVAAASSAALLYHSTGRGTSALSVRYSAQADRIEGLIREAKIEIEANLETSLTTKTQSQFQSLVIAFERLGNEELLEWISVTERHSAELG